MNIPDPVISFVTENGILLEFAPPQTRSVDAELQQRLCQLSRLLREHTHTGPLLCDIVTAPGSLLLLLHDGRTARRLLRHAETLWHASAQKNLNPATISIPVVYGGDHGPDLQYAADACGLTPQQLVQKHLEGDYFVHSLGFMPGFAYLGGLHNTLHIARKTTPSVRVPAGSVAIGGGHTGIYPAPSPGGWHIIGHTSVKLFDAAASQPCLLQAGDRVKFVMQETA